MATTHPRPTLTVKTGNDQVRWYCAKCGRPTREGLAQFPGHFQLPLLNYRLSHWLLPMASWIGPDPCHCSILVTHTHLRWGFDHDSLIKALSPPLVSHCWPYAYTYSPFAPQACVDGVDLSDITYYIEAVMCSITQSQSHDKTTNLSSRAAPAME